MYKLIFLLCELNHLYFVSEVSLVSNLGTNIDYFCARLIKIVDDMLARA